MKSPLGNFFLLKVALCLFLKCVVSSAWGVQPQRVVIDLSEDFAQGEVDSVILKQPGQLKPGPGLDLIYDFKNTLLWDAVELPQSRDLVIGSGPDGKVFRLDNRGKVRELTAFAESDVYAVAISPAGEIFAASSPDGKIFRLNRKGEFEVWYEHGEKYVWDMLFDGRGRLYVATGQTGKLFRVDGKNQGEVVFDAEEPHLRSLVADPQGGLIIGTTGSSLIYHYQSGKVPVVLLDAGRTDISAVAVSDKGIIYAAAVGKKKSSSQTSRTTEASGQQTLAAVRGLMTVKPAERASTQISLVKQSSQKQPLKKGNSAVCEIYRIDRNKYPRVIHYASEEIHSLAWGNGHLIAGAGAGGRFFEIRDDGRLTLLGKMNSKQVTALIPASEARFVLLGSNWGNVSKLSLERSEPGTYISKVIDSGLFARWGMIKVHGQGKWSIRTRSGNTANPDKSWYSWEFIKGEKPVSPQARYFQFEIRLESGFVERVDFTYLPQNQAPEIKVVKALKPNQGFMAIKQPTPAAKVQTASQLIKSDTALPRSVVRYRPVTDSGLRTIVWEASDPNGDPLRYRLEVMREGGQWEVLANDLEDAVFSWDTRGWPDGSYYARVTASDYVENGDGQELSVVKTSEAWRIDHSSPQISLLTQSEETVRVRVTDAGGVLEAVAVSTDGQSYRVSVPEDGILDSENEEFTLSRKTNFPLYIRVRDENGNVSGLHIPADK